MHRWLCAMVMVLAGCVDLTSPPELTKRTDATVAMVDDAAAPEDAPSEDTADDTALDAPEAIVDAAQVPDAPVIEPDAAEPDAPLVMNGRPCATNAQCQSNVCVDEVCCSADCKGVCQACNVPGSLGTCVPVSAGQDPDDECPQDPPSSCGRDGTCNGQGACSRYREGTECAPGGCTGDKESAASTCNGAGACTPGKMVSCSPHLCMNGSCASSCTQQTECQAGFFCDGTACRPRRTPGQACAMAFECASGNCTDKVCCTTPCSEACHSCALPSSLGTCTLTPAGMDPRTNCPAEATTTCGRAGACDGKGSCQLHPSGTPCGAAQTCAGTAQIAASICNGLGVCSPGARIDCVGYQCIGNACGTSCTSAAQCATGYSCNGTSCVPLPAPALYWKMDEASGAVALDSSGGGLNGAYVGNSGMPVPSTVVPVPPMSFPDPSSRAFARAPRHAVQLANMPAAIKPSGDLTLSVWFRAVDIDTGPGGLTPGSELISGGDNYLMRLHSGDLEMSKRTSGGHVMCLGPVTTHLDGKWHHAAAVYSATTMKVYFDGLEKMSCANPAPTIYDRGKDLFVGRHGNDTSNSAYYDFEGNIDEVRIYTRALGPTEIAALAAGS